MDFSQNRLLRKNFDTKTGKKCYPDRRIFFLALAFLFSLAFSDTANINSIKFPLKMSANKRYFVDQNDKPFFIQSDTPWSLFVALTKTEAEIYLENRRQKGFNTITVNLIEHWFNGDSMAYPYASFNREGQPPFTQYLSGNIPDFTKPNEKYFAHVNYVLNRALEKGLMVMMTPAYMGYIGTQEGWYNEVVANGIARCREYGKYLGNRYKSFPNIIWIMDGDRNPDSISIPVEREIVAGIMEHDSVHFFTAHCHPWNSSRDQWEGESWLKINAVYTYNWEAYIHEKCLNNYRRTPVMPIMLFETAYEGEHKYTPTQIRAEMYWGWLCCIAGQQFGNNPIWKFASGWKSALDWQGSWDEAQLKKVVDSRNWYKLVPDYSHEVVIAGYGLADTYVSAARADDGETIIAYIPSGGEIITVDISKINGPDAKAWWFNPRNGNTTLIGIYPAKGTMNFVRPDSEDWLLVIDEASKNFPAPGQAF